MNISDILIAKKLAGSSITTPVSVNQGGTGADEVYTAQTNLGLMKRYTNLDHLEGKSFNSKLRDIFLAMADNTCIDTTVDYSSPKTTGSEYIPASTGTLKIYRRTRSIGYAEFFSGSGTSEAMWVGSLSYNYNFAWKKVYTTKETVPIDNGGTGATTAAQALTKLGAAAKADVGDISQLDTTAKTVVGAINEIYEMINENQ